MSEPIILPSGIFAPPSEVPTLSATTFTDIQVEAEGILPAPSCAPAGAVVVPEVSQRVVSGSAFL